ncbi:MAG TPA: OadG family protein [Desulforhopalus sp.]|nr:OadG family protein [Desulforhopalus sp.]
MIFEGVKLMIVGMTTVMLFLGLMILFINMIAWLTRGVTGRELEAIEREKAFQAEQRKKAKEGAAGDADEDIAVIAAAVAAYEAERFARA